jgi:hypothetical protein
MMNRNYDKFVEDFTEALRAEMPDMEINKVTMPKANGPRDALTIREPGAMTAPVVYLQDAYDSGMTAHECAETVAAGYARKMSPVPRFKQEDLFKNPENHLYACVVSKETNGKLLETSPHREIPGTDLCMLARYRIDDNSSYLINNSNFSYLGFDNPDEVMDMAISNTEREEFHCQGMGSMLADMIGSDDAESMEMAAQVDREGLYVVTNKRMNDGAVVLGLPGKMKEMVEATGEEKAYVLPSSRNEILLLPESIGKEMSVDKLETMIHEINDDIVQEQDVLSQKAYFWNGKSLCMAKDLEKAMPEKADIGPEINASQERAKVSARAR